MPADPHRADFSEPIVIERFYERDLTGRARAVRLLRRIAAQTGLTFGLAGLLLPLQLAALVTVDLPLTLFDSFAGPHGLAPSLFLSRGDGLYMLSLLASLLFTRRWGASVAARVVAVSWLFTLGLFALLLVDLAPSLEAGDFPSRRFALSLLGSWLLGQWVGVWIYQLTRGGAWWRAPVFGACVGLGVQAVVFYPSAFLGELSVWPWWLAVHLVIACVVSAAFALVHGGLRRAVRPISGLGGR